MKAINAYLLKCYININIHIRYAKLKYGQPAFTTHCITKLFLVWYLILRIYIHN